MTKTIGTSALLDIWGATGAVVKPTDEKFDLGWNLGERPPKEWLNYLDGYVAKAVNHILLYGIAEWHPDTSYVAGSMCKIAATGKTYIALTANTDAMPPNAKWKETLAAAGVEALPTETVQPGSMILSPVDFPNNSDGSPNDNYLPGYVRCRKQLVPRAGDYARIFQGYPLSIGTKYGQGDGSTTFRLPGPQGYFLRFADLGAGVDPDAATRTANGTGGLQGNNVGTLQGDALGEHEHRLFRDMQGTAPVNGTDRTTPTTQNNGFNANDGKYYVGGTNLAHNVGRSEKVGAKETRAKNIAFNLLMKM